MSISAAGEFHLDPFDRKTRADPVGQFIGTGVVIGDASGGSAFMTFSLPQQFAYIILATSLSSTLGADLVHSHQMVTGLRQQGIDETYNLQILTLTTGGVERSFFEPPRMISLPGPVVPSISLSAANNLGTVFTGAFRAIVFNRISYISEPSALWRDWLI